MTQQTLRDAAEQALACMTGLQQHLGYSVCDVEANTLRAALAAQQQDSVATRVAELEAEVAALRPDARLFRKLLSYQYWHRQELVRHKDVRRAVQLARNEYRDAVLKEQS